MQGSSGRCPGVLLTEGRLREEEEEQSHGSVLAGWMRQRTGHYSSQWTLI